MKKKNRRRNTRFAGLIYLFLIISGIISMIYVPEQLIDWKNASATINNISSSKNLFKIGIISGVICTTLFIVLPLILFRLFQETSNMYAVLMVLLAIISVPIQYIALSHQFNVLDLIGESYYYKDLPKLQLSALVMHSLDSYYNGIHVSKVFWGLWLLPFGYLVYHSGFLPKFFGVFLIIGCFGYLVDFVGATFYPKYYSTLLHDIVNIPSTIGEIGICFWMLILGDRKNLTLKTS